MAAATGEADGDIIKEGEEESDADTVTVDDEDGLMVTDVVAVADWVASLVCVGVEETVGDAV